MKKNFVIISNSLIAKYVLTTKSTKILDQCAACVQPLNNMVCLAYSHSTPDNDGDNVDDKILCGMLK